MAYTAWSVVFGEQPSAAKWNQLGANDAGFKDGTNIDDDAITPDKRTGGHYAVLQDLGSGTGNVSITGVPFAPNRVDIIGSNDSSTSALILTVGYAVNLDGGGGIAQGCKSLSATSSNMSTRVSATNCIIRQSAGNTLLFVAGVTSFNSDGITLNKTTASANADERTYQFIFSR